MSFFIVFFMGSSVLGQVQVQLLQAPPPTSFACHGRPPGYYADLDSACKAYHVCDGNAHFTYLCPKGTLFQQRTRICDHSHLVTCHHSTHFYLTEAEAEAETETEYPHDDIYVPFTEPGQTYLDSDVLEEECNQTESYTPTITEELPETTTTTKPETETPTTQKAREKYSKEASQSIDKVIKFRLKDFRSLFYIPELDNNSILAVPEKELSLPLEKNQLMRFRYRKWNSSFPQCPSHCNPTFFLPGLCHPCIMIK